MSINPGPIPGPAAPQAAEESPGAGRGGGSPAARSRAGQVHALRVLAGLSSRPAFPAWTWPSGPATEAPARSRSTCRCE